MKHFYSRRHVLRVMKKPCIFNNNNNNNNNNDNNDNNNNNNNNNNKGLYSRFKTNVKTYKSSIIKWRLKLTLELNTKSKSIKIKETSQQRISYRPIVARHEHKCCKFLVTPRNYWLKSFPKIWYPFKRLSLSVWKKNCHPFERLGFSAPRK